MAKFTPEVKLSPSLLAKPAILPLPLFFNIFSEVWLSSTGGTQIYFEFDTVVGQPSGRVTLFGQRF
ncbi:MAG: hypothetical protein J7641_14355 [Cyanobacteria bacterium SID2]|nr:hypothetical protein [Cyanobacteria bacterium SID2]MBP0005097.1 hypothetical protein [Cyanobacteria bacterium SBC]